MALSATSLKTTTGERNDQSAYFIAEAAITNELPEIDKAIQEVYQSANNETSFYNMLNAKLTNRGPYIPHIEFEDAMGNSPKAEVQIIALTDAGPGTYKIVSTGTIGQKQRTAEREIQIDWAPKGGGIVVPKMAALVKDTISLSGGAGITGDIGTLKKGPASILASGKPTVNGAIFVPPGSEKHAVSGSGNLPEPTGKNLGILPALPPFPAFPELREAPEKTIEVSGGQGKTYQLDSSRYFKKITIKSNQILKINVGNTDKEIIVDELEVSSGHIQLLGTGKLTIYVKEEISLGGGSTINSPGTVNRLDVFLKGSQAKSKSNSLSLSGSQIIFGSLYAENADIEFTGGGGFQGNIFTGGREIKVSGGAETTSPLILAPNAAMVISGGGKVTGVTIAKSLKMSGGTHLEYKDMQFTEGPISIEGLGNGNGPGSWEPNITKGPLREQ